MTARVLPCGQRAFLVECGALDEALRLRRDVFDRFRPDGLADAVLGATSVLVVATSVHTLPRVRDRVTHLVDLLNQRATELDDGPSVHSTRPTTDPPDAGPLVVEVDYSGPDLQAVADLTGLTTEEVVAAHTATPWRVAFAGFAPGFAYLVGGDPRLRVPRRDSPRVTVPAGSVALAEEFSGIYPRQSPGGWQILGRTGLTLWDLDREPPALLTPGREVRFVASRSDPADGLSALEPSSSPPSDTQQPLAAGATSRSALEILSSARRPLLQDGGRAGLSALGVAPSGAADRTAYELGARLLGQGSDEAALEVLLGELQVRAHGSTTVALTGAPAPATIDGRPVPYAAPLLLSDGQMLGLGRPTEGLRTYLSVRGGFAVAAVLGSRSQDTLSGLGPGEVLPGDQLPVGLSRAQPPVDVAPVAPADPTQPVELRGTWGPHAARLADPRDVFQGSWRIGADSDRVGVRLEPVEGSHQRDAPLVEAPEVPPVGLVRGAIQLPPSGIPVVLLSDHPVTGGYPVVAVLDEVSIDRAAQLRPGSTVRLVVRDKPLR